jgi:NAD kinase
VSAHSLTARPMIFSSESKLEIFGCGRREGKACLTVDGGVGIMLPRGSRVTVKKSSRVTKLIRFGKSPFCETLQKKLSEKDTD